MTNPTVVLTRDPAGNQRWAAGLRRAGFAVLGAPMIETAALGTDLPELAGFDWLVLTSPRAVQYLQALISKKGLGQAKIAPVAAVGPATAAAALEAGWDVKFKPRPATAASLGRQLEPVLGRRILVARSALAGPGLAGELQVRGARVTDLPVYDTQPRSAPDPSLQRLLESGAAAAFVLASPSAVRAVTALHPQAADHAAVAIGPTTEAAARAAGFSRICRAAAPTLPSIISALKLL